jgi:hypothetical protein
MPIKEERPLCAPERNLDFYSGSKTIPQLFKVSTKIEKYNANRMESNPAITGATVFNKIFWMTSNGNY